MDYEIPDFELHAEITRYTWFSVVAATASDRLPLETRRASCNGEGGCFLLEHWHRSGLWAAQVSAQQNYSELSLV
jgi:hypothetical protein